MGLFDGKKLYAGKYSVKFVNAVSEDDKKVISSVSVVPSEFGLSACFTLVNGFKAYIPMNPEEKVEVGDELNIDNIEIVTLERLGSEDIERVRIKA